MSTGTSPNADTIEHWNDVLFAKFERFRDVFVPAGDAHSRGPLARAGLAPGMRALDVGCGFGETTLQIARLVEPGGSVVGTDATAPFLAIARADAHAAGITNATFQVADAQIAHFEPEFDLAFARFGTMFFADPVAGMRNVGMALVPGGRLLMVVWRPLEDNEWMSFAERIARKHLPGEAPADGPGPFSMADADVVTAILGSAGYADVAFERTDARVRVGATVDEAIAFQLSLGPASSILRDAGDEGRAKRAAIEDDLRATIERHARPDGVWMNTSSWAVTARRAA
jgi:SAM-dependent methyltransferase